MLENRSESIIVNQMLNRKIVYAVNKAVSDDVPQVIRENRIETNNRHIFATGDYINENLRKHVVKDEIDLIPKGIFDEGFSFEVSFFLLFILRKGKLVVIIVNNYKTQI